MRAVWAAVERQRPSKKYAAKCFITQSGKVRFTMAQDGIVATVTGRWGSQPESKQLVSGKTVHNGRLAVGSRVKVDGAWANGPTLWLDVTAWEQPLAGNKGDQVELTGRINLSEYRDKEGNPKQSMKMTADSSAVVWSKGGIANAVAVNADDDDMPF
jgi:single-stranded DNA-binding protein